MLCFLTHLFSVFFLQQYLPTCDIRERPDKMEFRIRIQGKRAYYELRSADLTDFQAWQLVFQRARDWKDPNSANTGNLDGYVLIQNDARGITRTASFDSLSGTVRGNKQTNKQLNGY